MFNFFRKKERPEENKVEVPKSINFRQEKALMDDPSFSLLLQLDQETGEYIFAIDANDKSIESAEMAATLLCNLVHGELNTVLIDAIKNYPDPNDMPEQTFVAATLEFWKEYEVQILEALEKQVKDLEKEKKRKIDPTKIFNVRGEKNER
jgi:hypothetical protein